MFKWKAEGQPDVIFQTNIKRGITGSFSKALKILQQKILQFNEEEYIYSNDASNNLCSALEAAFLHGLKDTVTHKLTTYVGLTAAPEQTFNMSFWSVVVKFTHSDVVTQLQNLSQINTEIGMCRAWIRLALNDGLIESYLHSLIVDTKALRHFYHSHSFLRDHEQPSILKNYLTGLMSLDFKLSFNSSVLNSWNNTTLQLIGVFDSNLVPAPAVRSLAASSGQGSLPSTGSRSAEPTHSPHGHKKPSISTVDLEEDKMDYHEKMEHFSESLCSSQNIDKSGPVGECIPPASSKFEEEPFSSQVPDEDSLSNLRDYQASSKTGIHEDLFLPPKPEITYIDSVIENISILTHPEHFYSRGAGPNQQEAGGGGERVKTEVSGADLYRVKSEVSTARETVKAHTKTSAAAGSDTDCLSSGLPLTRPRSQQVGEKDDKLASSLTTFYSKGDIKSDQQEVASAKISSNLTARAVTSLDSGDLQKRFNETLKLISTSDSRIDGPAFNTVEHNRPNVTDTENLSLISSPLQLNLAAKGAVDEDNIQADGKVYEEDDVFEDVESGEVGGQMFDHQVIDPVELLPAETKLEHFPKNKLSIRDSHPKSLNETASSAVPEASEQNRSEQAYLETHKVLDNTDTHTGRSSDHTDTHTGRSSDHTDTHTGRSSNHTDTHTGRSSDHTGRSSDHTGRSSDQPDRAAHVQHSATEKVETLFNKQDLTGGQRKQLHHPSPYHAAQMYLSQRNTVQVESDQQQSAKTNSGPQNPENSRDNHHSSPQRDRVVAEQEAEIELSGSPSRFGNSLNSMSGWSSEIESNWKRKKSATGDKIRAESFATMLQGYTPSSSYQTKAVTLDQVIDDLPCESDSSDSEGGAVNRKSADSSPQRNPDNSPSSRVYFLFHVPRELGLSHQNFACKGCLRPIGIIYGHPRLCEFDGGLYCESCHDNSEAYIPSSILFDWDFRKKKVCQENYKFLQELEDQALYDVEEHNPRLYNHVPELQELKLLRQQLCYLKSYLFTCSQKVAESLRQKAWPREHLYDRRDLYSIADFLQVHSGTLQRLVKDMVKFSCQHVYDCVLCNLKGFVCEICRNPQVIYPFEVHTTLRCKTCKAVYHKTCMTESLPCPKCERWGRHLSNSSANDVHPEDYGMSPHT